MDWDPLSFILGFLTGYVIIGGFLAAEIISHHATKEKLELQKQPRKYHPADIS